MPVTKKKKFYLNLNQYRNAHHFTLAKAKINYHEIVAPLLHHLPFFHRIEMTYTLFTGTEQLCDVPNICSIVDKFFSDVLVSCKKIEDDNRKFVLSVCYRYGGVDRFNPRVEVTITPVEDQQREEPMQITIIQSEIEEAIEKHIREQIVVKDDFRIDIELRATRGEDGYQAIIDIVPAKSERKARPAVEHAPVQAAVKAAAKATRPKAVTPAKIEGTVVAEDEPEVEAEVEAEVATPVVAEEEAPFDTAEEAAVVAAEAEPAVEPEAAPKRQSLFGSMTAPVNS